MSLKRLGDYFSDGNEEIILHVSEFTDVGYIDKYIRIYLKGELKISGRPVSDFQMLQVVELPEGLERIGSWWFGYNKAEKIKISSSVREIGSHAFY